ncbi:MAG TPA: hypothetical protein DDY14_00825 [Chromatiaceae bacterium]|nr:MAG: hypothetical protein N838_03970 [Thiohalocapsa sp. PB-PSB1]HBG93877.1 hypothetical protein [Chromatiaceae bacterium]
MYRCDAVDCDPDFGQRHLSQSADVAFHGIILSRRLTRPLMSGPLVSPMRQRKLSLRHVGGFCKLSAYYNRQAPRTDNRCLDRQAQPSLPILLSAMIASQDRQMGTGKSEDDNFSKCALAWLQAKKSMPPRTTAGDLPARC